jgi:hypothetical protein
VELVIGRSSSHHLFTSCFGASGGPLASLCVEGACPERILSEAEYIEAESKESRRVTSRS